MTKAQKIAIQRGNALDAHIAAHPGPFDPDSLSRSYGVDATEVRRILKYRGKLNG